MITFDCHQTAAALGAKPAGKDYRCGCPVCRNSVDCGVGHSLVISPGADSPVLFKNFSCSHSHKDVHEWLKINLKGYWSAPKTRKAGSLQPADQSGVSSGFKSTPAAGEQVDKTKENLAAEYGLTWANYQEHGCTVGTRTFKGKKQHTCSAVIYPVLLSDGRSRRTKNRSIQRFNTKRLAQHGGQLPDKWTGSKCGLFPAVVPASAGLIDVCAGEEKALLLRKLGKLSFSYTGGEGTLPIDICQLLISWASDFRLTYDIESHPNALLSARVLLAEAAAAGRHIKVYVTPWPENREKGHDINSEFTLFGRESLLEILESASQVLPTRDTVMLSGDAAVNIGNIKRLLLNDESVYRRGDALVYLSGSTSHAFETITLWARVAELAEWLQQNSNGQCVAVKPPRQECEAVANSNACAPFRELRGVLFVPIIRTDGSVFQSPGYDPVTGYVLHTTETWDVPQVPDVDMIRELVSQVCFDGPESLAGWVTFVLTMLCPYMPTEGDLPGFAFEASVRGTGKGMLVHIASILATGREATGETLIPNDQEIQKELVARHLESAPYLFFDEVPDIVKSKALCSLLTSKGHFSGRILGVSKSTKGYWRPVVIFCGNNTVFGGDMDRRILLIRMEPDCPNPEDTIFKIPDILDHVKRNRKALVENMLAIMRQYLLAGSPKPDAVVWQSFPQWFNLYRPAVMFAGFADPDSRTTVREDSTDTTQDSLRIILEWLGRQPDSRTAPDMLWHAKKNQELAGALTDLCEMPDAVLPNPRMLGKRLAKYNGVVAGGLKLKRKKLQNRYQFFATKIELREFRELNEFELVPPIGKRVFKGTMLSEKPFSLRERVEKTNQNSQTNIQPQDSRCLVCFKPIPGEGLNGTCSVKCAADLARDEAVSL